MISAHTPPGTKVVCLRVSTPDLGLIIPGNVYTVAEMVLVPTDFWDLKNNRYVAPNTIGVRVEGVWSPFNPGTLATFNRETFSPVDLPKCLTELLTEQPVDA